MMERDPFAKALAYAQRFLSAKDRSKREVETKLKEKGYGSENIGKVIEYLSKKKLLDDERFAREWIKARAAYSPKGLFAIKDELARKGLSEDLIQNALNDPEVDYDERRVAASLAGRRKASSKGPDKIKLRKDIYGYLARRGFSFDIINDIIDTL